MPSVIILSMIAGRLLRRPDGLLLRDRFDRRMLRGWPFLHALHQFRVMRPFDLLLLRRAIELRMDVEATLAGVLCFFHRDAVSIGPRVLANASNLPGDLQPGTTAADFELIVGQLLGYVNRSKSADAGQLVAEIAV